MKNPIYYYIPILSMFLLFLFENGADAQQRSIFDLMDYKEGLSATLEADFEYLKNNRRSQEEVKARLSFEDASGNDQLWNLKIKVRGNFRRIHCSEMPPLKLNFKKAELAVAGLALFDDMKLVTYCTSDKEEAAQLLLKEYLAYQLYNELTENSYRVQLLQITYKDSNTRKKTKQWGFLIEDTAQLKARLGAETVENIYGHPANHFAAHERKLVALYQYIIGNSDWSFATARNIKLLAKDGKIIPVPYDFDFSGLVNASYAIPNPNYVMSGLKDRIFLGFPEDLKDMHNTIYQVYGKRQVLLERSRSISYLNYEHRKEVEDYLKSYLKDFENIKMAVKKQPKVINVVSQFTE